MNELASVTIAELLRTRPKAAKTLEALGLQNVLDKEFLEGPGLLVSLGQTLALAGLDLAAFESALNNEDGQGEHDGEMLGPNLSEKAPLRVVVSVPCPLKVPMDVALRPVVEKKAQDEARLINLHLQSCGSVPLIEQAERITNADDIPDLILAGGYNSLLSEPFRRRFADQGFFVKRPPQAIHPRLAAMGLDDPEGVYHVLAVNVFVFAVDMRKLEGDTPPETWEELLASRFASSITMCGSGEEISESLLLHIDTHFGREGLLALGRSVQKGMHPSQVIKNLGSDKPDTPTVGVMPWFFAESAGEREHMRIIWPKDGAVATPVFTLVRADQAEQVADLAAFLEGPQVGKLASGAFLPSLRADVDCPIPPDAPLSFLGWDALRERDLTARIKEAKDVFLEGFRQRLLGRAS